MWTFIVAGALYLIGVAIMLVLKPEFMFTPDGNWKEFGIGKNKARYTPFPFWLFCLLWAVVSYTIVLLLLPFVVDVEDIEVANASNASNASRQANARNVKNNARNNKARKNNAELEMDSSLEFDDDTFGQNPQKGYYVLNRKASKIAGVPKYVYIGEEEP
jgi:hypothetical protein